MGYYPLYVCYDIYSPWGAELSVNGVLSAVGLLGYIQSLGC